MIVWRLTSRLDKPDGRELNAEHCGGCGPNQRCALGKLLQGWLTRETSHRVHQQVLYSSKDVGTEK